MDHIKELREMNIPLMDAQEIVRLSRKDVVELRVDSKQFNHWLSIAINARAELYLQAHNYRIMVKKSREQYRKQAMLSLVVEYH